jgi:hypothetical protein
MFEMSSERNTGTAGRNVGDRRGREYIAAGIILRWILESGM